MVAENSIQQFILQETQRADALLQAFVLKYSSKFLSMNASVLRHKQATSCFSGKNFFLPLKTSQNMFKKQVLHKHPYDIY